jgi:hypothetical protein
MGSFVDGIHPDRYDASGMFLDFILEEFYGYSTYYNA